VSNANVEACKVVAMKELEATQKQLTLVLKQNMKSERLLESCKIYTRLGMRDKALEVMKKIEALGEHDECIDVSSEVLDGSLEEVASCPETSPLSVGGSECIVQCESYTKSSKVYMLIVILLVTTIPTIFTVVEINCLKKQL
jgi:hypothetical protein